MTERAPIDRSPTRLGVALAVGAGLLGSAAAVFGGGLPALVALFGTAVVGVGGYVGDRRALGLGASGVVAAALATGFVSGTPLPALVAGAAGLLAWDVGENAISVGERLGSTAPTRDLELVHAAASACLLVVAATVVALVARVGLGGRPVVAVFALLVGALAIAWTLRA